MPSRAADAHVVDENDVEDTEHSSWTRSDADEADVHEVEDDTEGHGKNRCC